MGLAVQAKYRDLCECSGCRGIRRADAAHEPASRGDQKIALYVERQSRERRRGRRSESAIWQRGYVDDLAPLLGSTDKLANWRGQIAFVVNFKRPFGDMTSFDIDMARILGLPRPPGNDFDPSLWRLYAEMWPALQTFVEHAQISVRPE